MEYQIRTYRPEDLSGITKFLHVNSEYDVFNEQLLHEKLEEDPDWEPKKTLVCTVDDKVLGFMQGVVRQIRGTKFGYIKLMAVDKNYRRQGIARKMYELLEGSFKSEKVDVVRFYDAPLNYFMPGIDVRYTPALCFAIRMGFTRFGDAVNLKVNLDRSWDIAEKEKALKIHGIEVERATIREKEQVLYFVKDEWALWAHEVEMAFKDNPPSIYVAKLQGKIKAFSAHNGNNKGTGWFGPMGTHPDLRGKGIGNILLKRCLGDMKRMRLKSAIIPWVDHLDFYAHHINARVDRVFWRYEKEFKNDK